MDKEIWFVLFAYGFIVAFTSLLVSMVIDIIRRIYAAKVSNESDISKTSETKTD